MDYHVWDATKGTAPQIQDLFGSVVSHLVHDGDCVFLRFTSGRSLRIRVFENPPDCLNLVIKFGADSLPSHIATAVWDAHPTPPPSLLDFVGKRFTGMDDHRLIFDDRALMLDPEGLHIYVRRDDAGNPTWVN